MFWPRDGFQLNSRPTPSINPCRPLSLYDFDALKPLSGPPRKGAQWRADFYPDLPMNEWGLWFAAPPTTPNIQSLYSFQFKRVKKSLGQGLYPKSLSFCRCVMSALICTSANSLMSSHLPSQAICRWKHTNFLFLSNDLQSACALNLIRERRPISCGMLTPARSRKRRRRRGCLDFPFSAVPPSMSIGLRSEPEQSPAVRFCHILRLLYYSTPLCHVEFI